MAAAHAGRLHPAVGGQVGRPEGEALHPRRGAADLLDVHHAAGGLEDRVHEDRPLQPGLGLELGEQPVDEVDVLGALHLRHHHHVELVADLGDQRGQVVEAPGGVERVDPRPQLGRTEVCLPGDLHQPGARGLLVVGLDGVLEVAEEYVDLADHAGDLRGHLLVAGVEEVDRSARAGRDLAERIRGTDRERGEEVLGAAHAADASSGSAVRRMTKATRSSAGIPNLILTIARARDPYP